MKKTVLSLYNGDKCKGEAKAEKGAGEQGLREEAGCYFTQGGQRRSHLLVK